MQSRKLSWLAKRYFVWVCGIYIPLLLNTEDNLRGECGNIIIPVYRSMYIEVM